MQARKRDPLQGLAPGNRKSSRSITRDAMIRKDRRIDPKTANIEELPPISGKKLWKLRHRKTLHRSTDMFNERKRMTPGQKKAEEKVRLLANLAASAPPSLAMM